MNTHKSIILGLLLTIMIAASSSAQISQPAVVGPDGGERTNSTPTLHWEQLDGASWYRIWIDNKTEGTTHLKKWVKGSNSWTIPDSQELTPGDNYRFWVAGWNSTDKLGPWSAASDFSAGTVHYTTVNSSEFVERGETRDAKLFYRSGRITHVGTDPRADAYASAHLPDDAVITKVTSHWEDNDPDGNLKVDFWERGNNGAGSVFADTDLASQGSSGVGFSTANGLSKEVDATNNYYQLQLEFPNTGNSDVIQFNTVRIKYIR